MSSSRNEFIIGCLLGGILGLAAAMLEPKKKLNSLMQTSLRRNGNHSNKKKHATSTSHPNHDLHNVRKMINKRRAASASKKNVKHS